MSSVWSAIPVRGYGEWPGRIIEDASNRLKKKPEVLEGYLARKASDLRKAVLSLAGKDRRKKQALESVDRLAQLRQGADAPGRIGTSDDTGGEEGRTSEAVRAKAAEVVQACSNRTWRSGRSPRRLRLVCWNNWKTADQPAPIDREWPGSCLIRSIVRIIPAVRNRTESGSSPRRLST